MQSYNSRKDLLRIIQKDLDGKSTPKERAFLELYYGFFEKKEDLLEKLSVEEKLSLQETMEVNILNNINQKKKAPIKIIYRGFYRKLAAASVFLALGFGAHLYFKAYKNTKEEVKISYNQKKEMFTDKATLTLADGRRVSLDDVSKGQIAEESGIVIEKLFDGSITYSIKDQKAGSRENNEVLSYNTITTPNGSLYKINLPDGTQVWLNAESALKYPISFVGNTRVVELTGEAYFEVAKNKQQPFIVKAKGSEVRVLGTHFNISAYKNDETIKTTLTEGSVLISKSNLQKMLRPGQQSLINDASNNIEIKEVDVEEALAWKNGYFIFNNEDIKTVMKTISRWYNIDVVYEGEIKNEVFIGTVSRFDSIEKLLKTIELTGGVKFKVEAKPDRKGKKVIVMP